MPFSASSFQIRVLGKCTFNGFFFSLKFKMKVVTLLRIEEPRDGPMYIFSVDVIVKEKVNSKIAKRKEERFDSTHLIHAESASKEISSEKIYLYRPYCKWWIEV